METLLSNCSSGVSSNVLWSSYLSNDQFDLTESFFDKDFGISDLFPIELPGSLHYDIKKLESSESISPSDISVTSDLEYDFPKVEIKNSDCMWSGLGSNANNINNMNLYNRNNQQQQQQNNNNEYQNYLNTTNLSMQNIPPGQSLLINSRLNQNQQNKKQQNSTPQQQQQQQQNNITSLSNFYFNKLSIPTLMASEFIKDREQLICNNTRPDTPISLDDDAPEFKHTVDLAACIMGSNNISLNGYNNGISSSSSTTTNTDQMIINKLKEQLEDTSSKNIDLRQIIPFVGNNIKKRSLTEVLNVIGSDENDEYNDNSSCDDDDNNCSDSEYDEEDNGGLSNSSSSSSNSSSNISISGNISNSSSIFPSPTRQNTNINNNYPMMHSDHSYTRSKDGVEDCVVDVYGSILETPSDSDEEIDVVSVGDKKLPTNPSDKDRRALQTKVAHKISARIVKTANGIRTIPPRRRDSYEPYNNNTQIGNITPNQIKSLGNSRYPTPAPTPYPIYNNTNNNNASLKNVTNGNNNRKRNVTTTAGAAKDEYLPSSNKRHRGKKYQQQQKSSGSSSSSGSSTTNHSHHHNNQTKKNNNNNNNDLEEADTIEKRNLHNDMERQRRIGLKNLFEALKKQIPSIKDKERAPKVNILREAAKLCDQLNRDDKLINNQKQQLLNQLQRREQLLLSLKSAQIKKEI